ncbi:MAG: ABC transporter ATP-binding protein [Nocardioidaceae bacterium]
MTVTPATDGRPPVVAVEGLTKRYGSQVAVDGLSLDVPRGVVAGFIGPNGAGKTTTMAMLLGLVRPTSGTGTVLEFPLDQPTAYLDRVGALVEGPAFWPGLTGIENLRVAAELGGHDPGQIPELLGLVRLSGRGDDRFGQYSLGMKQRLGIAAALIGDPELLVLDEPTNGLDPAGINEMRDLIAEISHDDRTVLVSSHLLSEVEQVCDWLIVIDHGALRYQGPAEGFLAEVTPVLSLAPERPDDLDRLAALVRTAGFDADQDWAELTVRLDHDDPRAATVALNKEAIGAGIVLAELHLQRPTLESHYLATVQGGDR